MSVHTRVKYTKGEEGGVVVNLLTFLMHMYINDKKIINENGVAENYIIF